MGDFGAGEGIRTLDPNLGKVANRRQDTLQTYSAPSALLESRPDVTDVIDPEKIGAPSPTKDEKSIMGE
jgi:hypothetical protein